MELLNTEKKIVPLYKFEINIKAITPIEFYNFPGIVLRGAFGWMLKQQTCLEKNLEKCRPCQFVQYCPYASIFESPNTGDASIMAKATNFPHPFVLSPVVRWGTIIQPDEQFTVYLSIFGESIKYFHFFIKALIAMGNKGISKTKGTYEITSIANYSNNDLIYTKDDGYIADTLQPMKVECIDTTTATVQFITPCFLKFNNEILKKPTIEAIITNIVRRYKIISNIYGGDAIVNNGDYFYDMAIHLHNVTISDMDIEWYSTNRFSKRQSRMMKVQGFMGSMTIEGNIREVYPLLKIGEAIHIGKQTSFGCGLIRLQNVQ